MLNLNKDKFEKYSKMLDNILTFNHVSKTTIPDSTQVATVPQSGNITNANKLLDFLKETIDDPELKGKFNNVYKIINPGPPTVSNVSPKPVS